MTKLKGNDILQYLNDFPPQSELHAYLMRVLKVSLALLFTYLDHNTFTHTHISFTLVWKWYLCVAHWSPLCTVCCCCSRSERRNFAITMKSDWPANRKRPKIGSRIAIDTNFCLRSYAKRLILCLKNTVYWKLNLKHNLPFDLLNKTAY